MRFLVSRMLEGENGASMVLPVGTRTTQEDAERLVAEETLGFRELLKVGVVDVNGQRTPLTKVLATLGIGGFRYRVEPVDEGERVQLASPLEMQKLNGRG